MYSTGFKFWDLAVAADKECNQCGKRMFTYMMVTMCRLCDTGSPAMLGA